MCPGHFSRACDGLAPSGSAKNPLGAVLNDGSTCRAASRDGDGRACLSLHSGVRRRSGDVHPTLVSHITGRGTLPQAGCAANGSHEPCLATVLNARKPEADLTLGRLCRV